MLNGGRIGCPGHLTVEPVTKFVPLTVRVNCWLPASAELGTSPGGTAVRLLMVGAPTVKGRGFDWQPTPKQGFVTVTL